LTNAYLAGAVIKDANLKDLNMAEAHLDGTLLSFVDLSTVQGLDTVRHSGPSSIGIETIYRSQGKIADAFLRGAGVPDNFITYAKSLTGDALEFYSAFISYSTTDEEFANRLYADLQAEGVRCWFAPEDLKIGESIRVHDKLLLVLSEHSILSRWVEDEVETAFERERRENRIVLFPIRLDGAVRETDNAWAAVIRRARHIGDFSRWKDHDSYKKAFARLLWDLKAGPGEKPEAQPTP
jgi:hypothetical protein